MDDGKLSIDVKLRMHHPQLLSSSRGTPLPRVFVSFSTVAVVAVLAGLGWGFLLGSATAVAALFWLRCEDVRRAEARALISRVSELSPGRAGIVLRETARDRSALERRLGLPLQ